VNPRRLYRCRHNRQLAGVASGMAEYLGLDPTVVRILWILSVFFGGFTILLYIVLAFVVPLEPMAMASAARPAPADGEVADAADAADAAGAAGALPASHASTFDAAPAHEHRTRGGGGLGFGLGVLLVVFGAIALVGSFPGWMASVALGPAFVLALGVALVVVALRRPSAET